MAATITNQSLGALLSFLGFEPSEMDQKKLQAWKHPQSGCVLTLPANKVHERPRPADLVGMRVQLEQQGHLEANAFDAFLAAGELPQR